MILKNLSLEQVVLELEAGKIETHFSGVELKKSWQSRHGEDISAIANSRHLAGGWIVVGLDDQGSPNPDANISWLKATEETVSNHIRNKLSPSWAVRNIVAHKVKNSECLFIEIVNPGDVVYWDNKAYKLIGTTSSEMKPHEVLELSLQLPGTDFSKNKYEGSVNPTLVVGFAQKVVEVTGDEFNIEPSKMSAEEILQRLNVAGTNTARVLFGNIKCRVVHFNSNGDIFDQSDPVGLYSILEDQFIEFVQSWTRKEATAVRGGTVSAPEELPYPPKALREVLANAVAHSLYQKDGGDVVVELHPNRITVRNNCGLEARAFVNKWFSRIHKTINKHLMNLLRVPKITDEQGTGKIRIFRYMMESGKREPVIEFHNHGDYGRWSISLYNDETDEALIRLYERLKENFTSTDECRMAQALLLWRKKKWSEILEFLDENYKLIAESVIENRHSPILRYDDHIYTKRWATVALDGQITRQFTEAEKANFKQVLTFVAFTNNRDGYLSAEEARQFIGLSNTKSEATQLARLFAEWKKAGVVRSVKKGQWQFLKKLE